jgi:hypothetical protein
MTIYIAGALMILGMVFYFKCQRACQRVILLTKNMPDSLTFAESWVNTRVFIKRKKLSDLIKKTESEEIRNLAKKAILFEMCFYLFFILGILIFLLVD